MRKIISILLALAISLTVLTSMVAFADSYVFEFGTPVYDDANNSVTVPIIFNLPVGSELANDLARGGFVDNINIAYELSGCTVDDKKTSTPYAKYMAAPVVGASGASVGASGDGIPASDFTNKVVMNVVLNKVSDNATIAFIAADTYVADAYSQVFQYGTTVAPTLTLWPSSTPEPVVIAAEANREVAGYTDVVNFSSSLTNVTATAPTLTFDLYEDGVKHNVTPYEVNLGNGVTLDGSTLNFKIAVYGAPTDKTITLVNPAVK